MPDKSAPSNEDLNEVALDFLRRIPRFESAPAPSQITVSRTQSNSQGFGLPAHGSYVPTVGAVGGGGQYHDPFHLEDASDAVHPGRLQVRAGNLGGVYPDGMYPGDTTKFYLTLADNGTDPIYIIAKLAVNSDGTFGAATVYSDTSNFTPDGTYVYLLIGTVTYNTTDGIKNISPSARGSQGVVVFVSPDGTLLTGIFFTQGFYL